MNASESHAITNPRQISILTKKYYFNAVPSPLSADTPFTRGLFGTRNERNSIRNIEVSAPSQEGFESHDM